MKLRIVILSLLSTFFFSGALQADCQGGEEKWFKKGKEKRYICINIATKHRVRDLVKLYKYDIIEREIVAGPRKGGGLGKKGQKRYLLLLKLQVVCKKGRSCNLARVQSFKENLTA